MLISDLPQIPNAVTGSEYIALMQNGVTCRATLSQAYGNGSIPVFSSVIPSSGNGIYLPSANTVGIAANNALGFSVTNPSSAVDYLQISGASHASPVAYISLSALGSDPGIGTLYKTKGTTTLGNQYNGLVENGTGRQKFLINGQPALEITDTYWNPNDIYPGPPNGWVVISSGWGDPTNSTDMISGVISVEATGYPGTPSGASLLIGSKGASGEIHFIGNGALGHVTIDAPVNANPIAPDNYSTYVNGIRFAGAFGASGIGPQIKVNPSGNISDASIPLTFYNFANGGYIFMSGNGSTHNLSINHVTNGVNYVNITPGASGNNAIIWAAGATGGQRLTLAGSDLGGVDICNGGQYNGTTSCAPLGKFFGDFATPNYFSFTCSSVTRYPTLAPDGSDTDIDILIKGKGAGLLRVGTYTNTGISNTGYITIKDAGGTTRRLMVG